MASSLPDRLCAECDRRLNKASNAMRRHAAGVLEAVKLNERGAPTDEQRRNYKAILVASFNDAQSAWDSYREHLIEHGLLPERP